jgi:hypothetical protein
MVQEKKKKVVQELEDSGEVEKDYVEERRTYTKSHPYLGRRCESVQKKRN